MMAWWCANLSFWGAVGLLGVLAACQAVAGLRSSRRTRSLSPGRHIGEALR